MPVESYQVQLERVQAAIAAIESGAQSYAVEGRQFTKADLRTLYEREKYLRAMVELEEANWTTAYAAYPGWLR